MPRPARLTEIDDANCLTRRRIWNPGNHLSSRGLPGGAEGIRTSDSRGAGTPSPYAAAGSARLNSEGTPQAEKDHSGGDGD
jgi:hypothetical protein